MTRQRLQEPPDDAVIVRHVDPDERAPIAVDGLVVDGRDEFAALRKRMRERNSGPDPVGPERSERTMAIAAGLPAARPVTARDGAREPGEGTEYTVMTEEEWGALPAGRDDKLYALIFDAVARGRIVRVPVPPGRTIYGLRMSLVLRAKRRGLRLLTRPCGVDGLAVRRREPSA